MELVRQAGLERQPGHALHVAVTTIERCLKVRQVRAPLERLEAELDVGFSAEDLTYDLGERDRRFMDAQERGGRSKYLVLTFSFNFALHPSFDIKILVRVVDPMWMLTEPLLNGQYTASIYPHDHTTLRLQTPNALRITLLSRWGVSS